MGKVFGIISIVLGIWFAMELYTEGTKNAFDGAVAFLDDSEESSDEPTERRTLPRRAGDRVERAFAEGAARREALLGE